VYDPHAQQRELTPSRETMSECRYYLDSSHSMKTRPQDFRVTNSLFSSSTAEAATTARVATQIPKHVAHLVSTPSTQPSEKPAGSPSATQWRSLQNGGAQGAGVNIYMPGRADLSASTRRAPSDSGTESFRVAPSSPKASREMLLSASGAPHRCRRAGQAVGGP